MQASATLTPARPHARAPQVVSQLSKIAFEKCVEKPSSELSSYEQRCIEATAMKALDSQKFIMGRMQNLDSR